MDLQQRFEVAAVDPAIDRPPVIVRPGQIQRRPTNLPNELTRHRQHGIPPSFHFQAPSVHAPEPLVMRVPAGHLRPMIDTLLVGGRSHQLPMKPLQRPPLLNKPCGQIIEKSGMGRSLPLGSKIAWGGHQPAPEVLQPDTVHHHPGTQRSSLVKKTVRQFEPTASLRKSLGLARGKHPQKSPRHHGPQSRWISAHL